MGQRSYEPRSTRSTLSQRGRPLVALRDRRLANRVYSGVPADMVGLEQVIKIGPMSGKSNVIWFLEKHGVAPTDKAVDAVLALAKNTPRLLNDAEILAAARA